ncbi:MAG: response regulator, partial [Thermoproteota archaeon]|nr:response regulator [Thermoproteota archaeon]
REVHKMFKTTDNDTLKQDKKCQPCRYIVLSTMSGSTTANEAMDDYEKYRPDFVIIDYKLPGKKNGLEAAKEILMSYPSGRILMLTAFHGVKDELKKDFFFDDKMIQILIKPVKLARLADIIIRN